MITNELIEAIVEEVNKERNKFDTDVKHATSLDLDTSQYSKLKSGNTDKLFKAAMWIRLARKYDIPIGRDKKLKLVRTPVFEFLTGQMEHCQMNGISYLFCDWTDIGKTRTAVEYCRTHKNAVYIDCSQVDTKQLLIREISNEFGIGRDGRYIDVYRNLTKHIRSLIHPPIVFLDEFGHLKYDAFMAIKSLWNATAPYCSFYAIGAEGLRSKMTRGINNEKDGFAETFRRFSKVYGEIKIEDIPKSRIIEETALQIIKANAPKNVDYNKILRQTMGEDERPSLTRISNELLKLR